MFQARCFDKEDHALQFVLMSIEHVYLMTDIKGMFRRRQISSLAVEPLRFGEKSI